MQSNNKDMEMLTTLTGSVHIVDMYWTITLYLVS
jgi:hypothetical protein